MAEQSVDGTNKCSACDNDIINDESPAALAAGTEGMCTACYLRREAAIRVATSRGFRMGRA